MIDLQENLTKKNVLIVLIIMALLFFLQFMIMREVKSISTETQSLFFQTKTLDKLLKRRANLVMRYKSALKFDRTLIPRPVETPTQFYAAIINTLSSTELRGAEVTKTAESGGSVSFTIKGDAGFFSLMDVLATFRQSSYMMRITELNVEGRRDGAVNYSFIIQAIVKAPEVDKIKAGGGA